MRLGSRVDVGGTRFSGAPTGREIRDRLQRIGMFAGQWPVNAKRGENHINESDCRFCMDCINA